jgi:hypothetical protein
VGDEITTGSESAKWFDVSVWVGRHFRSIPEIDYLSKTSISSSFYRQATRDNPNKNRTKIGD